MMISSPPLANVRYLLSRFLSSATLTLRMGDPPIMAIIAMILAVEDRFVFEVSTTFVYEIVPRVILLIDLGGPGFRISGDLQRQSLAQQSSRRKLRDVLREREPSIGG
jgi:hypothetical protein